MTVVVHKRHIVLYACIAVALLLGMALAYGKLHGYMSFIAQQRAAETQPGPATQERTVPLLQQLFSTSTLPGGSASSPASAQSASQSFRFEVVTTQAAQEQGLGGRADIPHGYGMLFVFNHDDTYGFWMKDMLVPIDMLWLSDNGTVVYALTDVSPNTYPTVFYPSAPARYVLETRAGESSLEGWTVGAKVPLPLPYGS